MSLLSSFTFNVNFSHALLFEQKLKTEFLPKLDLGSAIEEIKTYKLLTEIENGGQTYSVQLVFADEMAFRLFEINQKENFLNEILTAFEGQAVYFETLLEKL
ncbi:DUF4286 family protein [Marinilongibacter aquaticus]|uniref:DUF4286 family protein n=1 Tax=Marinilongibacter aquaticus TaxID=2975157 RepID=UPI0021BD373D|nr:DUF4286 family protein [Marinilongibacter aquaticus]UBM59604.1 DUF4286 family protein [Marinilongibacter aquaticus]